MKHVLFYFSIAIFLTACENKPTDPEHSDSAGTFSADSLNSKPATITAYYLYAEFTNKAGSTTRVTHATSIYSDSLLQHKTGIVLTPGQFLSIGNYCGITTKNNWAEPVYSIVYKKGADVLHGYVSQSYIACRIDTLKSGKLAVLTLNYNTSKETFAGNLLLLTSSGAFLDSCSIELDIPKEDETPHSFTYYLEYEELKRNTGLDGVTEAFYIGAGYDACGYPHITNTILWNGKKLLVAPVTYSVADADIFYEASYLVFPEDSSGRKSCILNIIEAEEDVDNTQENPEKLYSKKDSTVIVFKWNAADYSYSKGDTILKTSRTFASSNPQ